MFGVMSWLVRTEVINNGGFCHVLLGVKEANPAFIWDWADSHNVIITKICDKKIKNINEIKQKYAEFFVDVNEL